MAKKQDRRQRPCQNGAVGWDAQSRTDSLGRASGSTADLRLDENVEYFTDRAFLGDALSKRPMGLDLVAVATPVFVLHHVAALGQVGDDAVGAALRDPKRAG